MTRHLGVVLAFGLLLPGLPVPGTAGQSRVIGHTVQGRAIEAYHLGDDAAASTVVALGTMHGDEPAPRTTLEVLLGETVAGIDLWVIPALNLDGADVGARTNANGVDLNRNFPHSWAPDDSARYNSGPAAGSEPETQALMSFLDSVDPDVVVSLHQPFGKVDTSVSKSPALADALSRELSLPLANLDCKGPCHGTLTGWFNAAHQGEAITVEFVAEPTPAYLTGTAPAGLLAAVGGGVVR